MISGNLFLLLLNQFCLLSLYRIQLRTQTHSTDIYTSSNIGVRKRISLHEVSQRCLTLSRTKMRSLSRYLTRRRRIEIAHNLTLTERQIKVKSFRSQLCSIDIRPVFLSLRSGFKIGKTRRRSRESRLSGERKTIGFAFSS